MSELTTQACFGCGNIGKMDAYVTSTLTPVVLFGQERNICSGTRGPKMSCAMAAIKRLWQERRCPACGKLNESYNEHDRMALCQDCNFNLEYGRRHHEEEQKTTIETQLDALTKLVESIANYRGFGEHNWGVSKYPAWPFSLLDKPGSIVASTLTKALRKMWESAVKTAYADGFAEGSNLLIGLKHGTISSGQYDAETKKQHKYYIDESKEFKEQCAAATKAALALAPTNKER